MFWSEVVKRFAMYELSLFEDVIFLYRPGYFVVIAWGYAIRELRVPFTWYKTLLVVWSLGGRGRRVYAEFLFFVNWGTGALNLRYLPCCLFLECVVVE